MCLEYFSNQLFLFTPNLLLCHSWRYGVQIILCPGFRFKSTEGHIEVRTEFPRACVSVAWQVLSFFGGDADSRQVRKGGSQLPGGVCGYHLPMGGQHLRLVWPQ